MRKTLPVTAPGIAAKLTAFVLERYPFALPTVQRTLDLVEPKPSGRDPAGINSFRDAFLSQLDSGLSDLHVGDGIPDPTPRISPAERLSQARRELRDACDGFFARESIAASLTGDERREVLRGMVLTRAVDNRLKQFFTGGEVTFRGLPFQGKGFRSLGQEAIYAAAIRLRRGPTFRDADGTWRGDVVGPIIRDLGAALAMRHDAEAVRMVLNAQMGKDGPPMHGKDLHTGDFNWGLLPASAPLAISSLTLAGMGRAFARELAPRVVVSFIGEGGASLGEWHEAINLCAARRLPAIFCIENNQTALSTPVSAQSAVRVFADKAIAYGIPGFTVAGTDPDAIAAAFTWAAEHARDGHGPSLIELVAMRMCGHAHHDDMLYLGKEPPLSWEYPKLAGQGAYADPALYEFWAQRDPLKTYAERLEEDGVIARGDLQRFQADAHDLVEAAAHEVIAAPWPEPVAAGEGVFAGESPRCRVEVLQPAVRQQADLDPPLPPLEAGLPFDRKGQTFLDAIALGIGDALRSDSRVFVFGEDVGGKYGNAFLLLRPLLAEFGDRIIDSPLAEGAVLGVCVGAALAGQRPIGEMQFNDFVATGFNQLVNNAAMIRYRWGGSAPMVVRMPWGGLRHAGPYHSQNTEAWFYRTPGLKIVVPSTPHDARALFASAVADPDPVLYYEHIALYRDPRLKQALGEAAPEPIPLGRAALRRRGDDLAIVSYGAYVHVAMRVAETLSRDGIEASVVDLRSLAPLDRPLVLAVARRCHRV